MARKSIIREPNAKVPAEPSHALCYEGLVFLTYEEDGHEWTEAVPCRRCADDIVVPC